ncbi:MAG: ATP-binding protein [Polyangiales bacterium]
MLAECLSGVVVDRFTTLAVARDQLATVDLVLLGATTKGDGVVRDVLEIVEQHGRPVVVLFDREDEPAMLDAIGAGAAECLSKRDLDARALTRAIRAASRRTNAAVGFAHRQLRLRFVADLCHEIRAPLHVILGMAEVLAETSLDAEQAGLTNRLRGAGEHLSALIDDVDDLSRLEMDGFTLDKVEFDLHELVVSTLDFMSGAIRGKPIALLHRFGGGVPAFVTGDPRRLRQLLVNLLGNAIKFTERGHVELAVELDPETRTGNRLRFSITDTGIGIPAERQDEVFSSFVQASATVGRRFGGFGLGLHITKRLVERMGGTIGLTSVEGRGSTFVVTVPLGAPAASGTSVRSMLAVREPPPVRPPLRVLLVDDSADSCLLVRSYVARTEISLDTVESGVEALQRIEMDRYDVVLMDMNMPAVDGYETTARVRDWERERGAPPVPIVALTADALRDSVRRSFQVGCTAHVSKPVSKLDLLSAIRAASTGRPSAAPPIATPEPSVVALLPRYVANRRRDLGAMRDALARGDLRVVETLAHNMKGTGRSYGMRIVSELGRAIEQAILDADVERAGNLIGKLSDTLADDESSVSREAEP